MLRTLWMALSLVAVAGCAPLTFTVGVGPDKQALVETTVETESGHRGRKVAVIDVTGLLINADQPGLLQRGENPVALLHEKLRLARNDHRVKAVVLRLNTPGGGVTASDVMYQEVRRFKERSGKPVVALAMDVTASGGYYLACASDHVVAEPTSVVGSIGVIMQTISVKPALSRIGVEADAITSGPNKAAGSPLETMTPEQRAILQGLVDDFYGRFVEVVRTNRPGIDAGRFAEVTDGRVMSGQQAFDAGLVDEVGGLYDAFAKAKALAGVEHANLVLYHRPMRYVGSPYAAAPQGAPAGTQINVAQLNIDGTALGATPVGFYYLWTGGMP